MATQTAAGNATSWAFMAKAEAALARADLVAASRKGWHAAAYGLRDFARSKGWRYTGFRRLYEVSDRLADKYGDAEIDSLFDSADALEVNSVQCWDSRAGVEYDLRRVGELLRRLERLAV